MSNFFSSLSFTFQIFENKGAMMGCSNPHPHCQVRMILLFSTIPISPHACPLSDRRICSIYFIRGLRCGQCGRQPPLIGFSRHLSALWRVNGAKAGSSLTAVWALIKNRQSSYPSLLFFSCHRLSLKPGLVSSFSFLFYLSCLFRASILLPPLQHKRRKDHPKLTRGH